MKPLMPIFIQPDRPPYRFYYMILTDSEDATEIANHLHTILNFGHHPSFIETSILCHKLLYGQIDPTPFLFSDEEGIRACAKIGVTKPWRSLF